MKPRIIAIFPGENPRAPFMFYHLGEDGKVRYYSNGGQGRGVVMSDTLADFVRRVEINHQARAVWVEDGRITNKAPSIAGGDSMIAAELVKIAKDLTATDDVFYKMTPIRLKPAFATAACLANALAIKDAGYQLYDGYLTYDTQRGEYHTTAFFVRGQGIAAEKAKCTFHGFSIGYGGEGPHGMMEFGKMFGWTFSQDGVFDRKHIDARDPGEINLSEL